ncbi:MAG: GGDEF domain-containing protein [Lachnospiraceae bacterium]|nr:GGDEF domain-containing protein [Lachnospiraceae bacterium]
MGSNISTSYEEFLIDNRANVNRYLNTVLWFFVVTGPAIAIGVYAGTFHDISYFTCINITVVVILLSTVHLVLLRKAPRSIWTCLFALTALNVLIVYMSYSHVNIYLTWFLVPFLSLLYCDRSIYYFATALNYVFMFAATWINSPYEAAIRSEYDSSTAYFANTIGGFTIETLIMFVSGYLIGKLTTNYFKNLFLQYKVIEDQEQSMEEKMDLLDSMAEIYDNVNLIDFVNQTEMSLRDEEHKKHGIDLSAQTHTLMAQRIRNQVMPDQIDAFSTFTNIKTIRSRLANKKLISADFIDVVSGWFRAQYITVDSTLDGIPNVVIYTTRNVDEEKRREENLIRISMTDEMTRLYNRRCYDEDLREIRQEELKDDFVLFSVDVNGLKTVNDNKGHAAGDELIKGAADCLALSIGNRGKVYRTGGDEFMVIAYSSEPETLRDSIKKKAKEWHGIYTDEITMSIGYAAHKDKPEATIDDLEHIADEDMYSDKAKFYQERGIERRR